jgi:hypothetical protein
MWNPPAAALGKDRVIDAGAIVSNFRLPRLPPRMLALVVPGPFTPEALPLLVPLFVLGLLVPLAAGHLVYSDARERGKDNAELWGVLVGSLFTALVLPGVAAAVGYLLVR